MDTTEDEKERPKVPSAFVAAAKLAIASGAAKVNPEPPPDPAVMAKPEESKSEEIPPRSVAERLAKRGGRRNQKKLEESIEPASPAEASPLRASRVVSRNSLNNRAAFVQPPLFPMPPQVEMKKIRWTPVHGKSVWRVDMGRYLQQIREKLPVYERLPFVALCRAFISKAENTFLVLGTWAPSRESFIHLETGWAEGMVPDLAQFRKFRWREGEYILPEACFLPPYAAMFFKDSYTAHHV